MRTVTLACPNGHTWEVEADEAHDRTLWVKHEEDHKCPECGKWDV